MADDDIKMSSKKIKYIDDAKVEQIIRQATGDTVSETEDLIPPCKIKGKGIIYLWSPAKKYHISVKSGTTVYLVDEITDFMGRVLVFNGINMLAINPEELEEIGFN